MALTPGTRLGRSEITAALGPGAQATTVVFYDGVCGLCDRFVQFLLARDAAGRIGFAQLQGDLARRKLTPLGHDPADLDSVVVIADWQTPRQRVLTRSRGVLYAVSRLGGRWAALSRIAQLAPLVLADVAYKFLARRRYRLFGRFEACPLPRPEWRHRFLDQPIGRSVDKSEKSDKSGSRSSR